jgi:hypothetical protein
MDDFYGDSFMGEFSVEFEPPYEEQETIRWIEAYLRRVESMVKKLEDIFNGSTVSSTRNSSSTSSAY